MKRIAALSLTVTSTIIMSSPTYALAFGQNYHYVYGETPGASAEMSPVAQNNADDGSSGALPVGVGAGGAVLAVVSFGIYRAIKGKR